MFCGTAATEALAHQFIDRVEWVVCLQFLGAADPKQDRVFAGACCFIAKCQVNWARSGSKGVPGLLPQTPTQPSGRQLRRSNASVPGKDGGKGGGGVFSNGFGKAH